MSELADLVEPHRDREDSPLHVDFLPGRIIRFLKAGADRVGANERPPFGSCVLTWKCAAIDSAITDEIERGAPRSLWPEIAE